MSNEVRCPHGIVCDYIHTKTTIEGEEYVTGGEYWHTPDERCRAKENGRSGPIRTDDNSLPKRVLLPS